MIEDFKIDGLDLGGERELIRFCEGLWSKAYESKSKRHTNWRIYDDYWRGKQWQGKTRLSYMQKITINYIFNTLDQLNANLSTQPINFEIKSLNNNNTGKAHLLEAALIGNISRNKYRHKRPLISHNAMCFQSGWLKVWWNPTLNNGIGDVQWNIIDPYRVFPDPAVLELEDCSFFFDVCRMPVWQVRKYWSKTGRDVLPDYKPNDADRNPDDDRHEMEDIDKQVSTSETGVSPPRNTYYSDKVRDSVYQRVDGLVMVKTLYIRDDTSLVKKFLHYEEDIDEFGNPIRKRIIEPTKTGWRRIVYVANKVLESRTFPYWHGELCYIQNKFINDGTFWGLDFVKQLIDPQDNINRIYSDIIDHLKITIRPVLLFDSRSRLDATKMKFRDMERIPVIGNPNQVAQWFVPQPLSNEFFVFPDIMRRSMESVGSAQEVMQGKKPGSVTAASAISLLQQAAGSRIGLRFIELESAYEDSIRQSIALMQQYYQEERWVRIRGNDGNEQMISINPDDIKGEWEVVIAPFSGLPTPVELKYQRLIQILPILANTSPQNLPLMKMLIDYSEVPELAKSFNNAIESQAQQNVIMANEALQMQNNSSAQGEQGVKSIQ